MPAKPGAERNSLSGQDRIRREQALGRRQDQAADAARQLRDLTRQAHEAAQALKDALREARTFLDTELREMAQARIDREVKRGLDEYRETLDKAITGAEEGVYKRFDTMATSLLGEDLPEGERLEDALARYRDRQRILEAHMTRLAAHPETGPPV